MQSSKALTDIASVSLKENELVALEKYEAITKDEYELNSIRLEEINKKLTDIKAKTADKRLKGTVYVYKALK